MKVGADVLAALRAAGDGFVSGERLAELSGLTRAAVWKKIEELRSRGYLIDARTHLGYRLRGAPDTPYPEEVREGLSASVFGREVFYLPSVTSTNEVAKKLAAEGCPEGTLVAAEEQTAGRGRLGRRWVSPPGGLWFSLVLRPGLALTDLGLLTVAAAVALRRAVQAAAGVQAEIKWPNDLLVNGRKIAGILAEASGELGCAVQVILGVGVNINQRTEDFSEELRERATSLRAVLGRPAPRLPVLRAFLSSFEELYAGIGRNRCETVLAEAAAHSATLGRRVRVTAGGRVFEGLALRLDPDGALVLGNDEGEARILTGEVERLDGQA